MREFRSNEGEERGAREWGEERGSGGEEKECAKTVQFSHTLQSCAIFCTNPAKECSF